MHNAHPLDVLKRTFGYESFRGQQAEIIDAVLAGNDALVLMPTGGGKSLCYQVPALALEGTAIVISPLIALMQDQVTALKLLGVNAAFINSSQDNDEKDRIERQLVNGELDLLYLAPERLMMPTMLQLLARTALSLIAIDEAHCVSQWGHDFRPEYIQLSILHESFPGVPRIALTATADETTRAEIQSRLNLEDAPLFISGFDRPNIRYRISENLGNARDALFRFIQNNHENEAGIVYCLSRKKVEATAEWLCSKGLTTLPYHAGLSQAERQSNQERFLREDGVIIVATIAFGMGIDKPDVRFVAHLSLPKSIEAYYQETGRAGRDGLHSDAWMSYGLQDVITLRQMQQGSEANETFKRVERHKLDAMLGLCEITSCRRQHLLGYFGDALDEPCGNCDNCLQPPDTWDGTVAAQKAISCAYRTGQRFGVNYLIDVLLGNEQERILRFGHDKVSTWGIGKELSANEWRSVYRQLIAQGLLKVDVEGHGSLQLTQAVGPLNRGEVTLQLRKLSKTQSRKGERKARSQQVSNQPLWEAVRALRSKLAEEQGVPAYVIFHDATLMEMVERQPQTREQLARISGVGERKLDAYGDVFLEVIAEHQENNSKQGTVEGTLQLLGEGKSPSEIARQRDLKESTIYAHLASAIKDGSIELEAVVQLPATDLTTINEALEINEGKLRPTFDALGGAYDYNILKCVQASIAPS